MCIAIYKPENKIISEETLQECYNANSDGAGFMFAEDKQLHIQKGFFTFDDFMKAYEPHKDKKTVIHFRIKTHGKIDETNCHPFKINNSLGFVHNGIINGLHGDVSLSDTIHFNQQILQPLVNKWGNLALFQDPMIDLIEGRIGYSKLIFLDRHGNHKIMNEKKGEWDDGVWYSNNSYKPYVPAVTTFSSKSWYADDYDYVNWRKPVATYKTSVPVTKPLTVATGEMVELLEDIFDQGTQTLFETGTLMEIVAVNKDFTCDLMTEDTDTEVKFLYNVPYHSLSFVDDFGDDSIDPVGTPAYQKYPSPYLLKGNK